MSEQGSQHVPSGPKKESPATAGKDKTKVQSDTPENRDHRINPSAPNEAITPPSDRRLEP